eukprot:754934-Hanusia_phi.AAC.1
MGTAVIFRARIHPTRSSPLGQERDRGPKSRSHHPDFAQQYHPSFLPTLHQVSPRRAAAEMAASAYL